MKIIKLTVSQSVVSKGFKQTCEERLTCGSDILVKDSIALPELEYLVRVEIIFYPQDRALYKVLELLNCGNCCTVSGKNDRPDLCEV